jgi:ubiquinone/menaquinone biosynthesis C-methylase UbiE
MNVQSMLKQNFELLRCPDDRNSLLWKGNYLECIKCKRVFHAFSNNLVELLPSKPYPFKKSVDEKYWTSYIRLLEDRFEWNPLVQGWGDLSRASKGYKAFVRKERNVVANYLGESVRGNFCDVSGGAGNYSLYFADIANLTVHCDLDVNSINGVYEQGKECSKSILFVRCDYLQLPFASNVFDSIICIDTLERGYAHEMRLLTEILRCLKSHGKFVVDFHNKLRVSCLPFSKMKSENTTYDYAMLQEIFSYFDLYCCKIEPFGYIPMNILPSEELYTFLNEIFHLLLVPCVRWVVAGKKK